MGSTLLNQIGIIHLVRAVNGIVSFDRFIRSYVRTQTDLEHELVILYKGFQSQQDELPNYEARLVDLPHRTLHVPDIGFDIEPYFTAARSVNYPYLCFLNSFSVILDTEWLDKLYRQICRPGVGIVGATGSYLSWATHSELHLEEIRRHPSYNGLPGRLRLEVRRRHYRTHFPAFPNPFLRTNAFMIGRELMLKVRCPRIRRKIDAYRFESGKQSLTAQVLKAGLRPLVVGRDGIGYEREEWHRTETFMQGEQSNLLVADNQTEHYRCGDNETRREGSLFSWGEFACPSEQNFCSSRLLKG